MSKTSSDMSFPNATACSPETSGGDPFFLEPVPGISREALRRDRLIHLLLTGLKVVAKAGGDEAHESGEQEGGHTDISEWGHDAEVDQTCLALAGETGPRN